MRLGLAKPEAVPAFLIDIEIERGAGALECGSECQRFVCGAMTPRPRREGAGRARV